MPNQPKQSGPWEVRENAGQVEKTERPSSFSKSEPVARHALTAALGGADKAEFFCLTINRKATSPNVAYITVLIDN